MRPHFPGKVQRAIVGALAMALTICACGKSSPAAKIATEPSNVALSVTTTAIHSEQVTRSVLASGAIFPWQEVVIGPEVGDIGSQQFWSTWVTASTAARSS